MHQTNYQEDDRDGCFFCGVASAFAIWIIGAAIFGMIWLFTSDAFASTDRPDLCAQYRSGEVAACIAEMGQ
ncbi:hypothetical protein [uncultured Paracoccus sp.]|jgi:hypothetical protein|uniref:hypothetical protein n=1 Tax=uncultured Paracoccus sp. TaxID=189685 RepID=UPI0030DCAEED|tara:strand:+ start:17064 stop:17276 length:213 start_codon:yes stop_codon:yes gene_type:complete